MLRSVGRRKFLLALLPFKLPNFHDRPVNPSQPKDELAPGEIGFDNLKRIFSTVGGELSPELQSVVNTSVLGWTIGFIWGGVRHIKEVPRTFIEENEATRFQSNFHAQRQMYNKTGLEFIKGGFQFSWRVAALSFLYMSTVTCLNVYQHKVEVKNYIFGGGLAGAIYKMNLGLKGMVAGMVAGSLLGALNGNVSLFILSMTGCTMDDFYTVQSEWAKRRKNLIREKQANHKLPELSASEKLYIQKTEGKKNDINAEDNEI